MRYIFLLSQEDLKLAKEEVLSLFNIKKSKQVDNLLFVDLPCIKEAKRLAFTKKVYQYLFEATTPELFKKILAYKWREVYKDNFAVRVHNRRRSNKDFSERNLASYIWNSLKNPKVNLKNPKTKIEFFVIKNEIYAAKQVMEIKGGFEERKAHKRPELHPTALNPKLARGMINLVGADKEIMDPFCGAGGILIEAGLMNLKAVGYDLYKEMLKKAKKNLDFYNIKNYDLFNKDALRIRKQYDFVVTDIPYGLNTSIWIRKGSINQKISLKQTNKIQKKKNLEDFYLKFLMNLKKITRKKAAVIVPHYVDYKNLIKKAGFKIEKEFSQFIHRSLTRKIVIIAL
jgi:tRNA (guanine10-N2)-dimethyltransferase